MRYLQSDLYLMKGTPIRYSIDLTRVPLFIYLTIRIFNSNISMLTYKYISNIYTLYYYTKRKSGPKENNFNVKFD